MAQTVSSSFTAAEAADVNQPTAQVQLVLGDYANKNSFATTVTSSGDDGSGNYPASGAFNGDHTEINLGAASASDNGVGLSSWKSSAQPDSGADVWLAVNFNQPRTINFIKLYHLSSHAIDSFVIWYWDIINSAWNPLVATNDLSPIFSDTTYGNGPYGDTPYGGSATTPTFITTNGDLDSMEFPDVTTTQIKISCLSTAVANDYANIVELEVYRKVDISDRVFSFNINRQKDFTLTYNISSSATVEVDNSDRFFSFLHAPTASEAADGFVNSELVPQIGLIIQEGFSYGGGNTELVPKFTGFIDSFDINSKEQNGTLEARDAIKNLINQVDTSNLKTSIDNGDAIVYLLNRANISNYEMSVDTTTITQPYFFTFQESIYTTIQNIVQACGDASFYFDESGIATFKMYLNQVPQSHTDSTQAEFESGSRTNCDTASVPGNLYLKRPWYQFTNYASWVTEINTGNNSTITKTGVSIEMSAAVSGTDVKAEVDTAFAQAYGTWKFDIKRTIGSTAAGYTSYIQFIKTAAGTDQPGYYLKLSDPNPLNVTQAYTTQLVRTNGVTETVVCDTSLWERGTTYAIRIVRDTDGNFSVYRDGVLLNTGVDNTYTTCVDFALKQKADHTTAINGPDDILFSGLYYNAGSEAFLYGGSSTITTSTADFISATVDQTASVNAEGVLQATNAILGTDPVLWYTRTSANDIAYDSDVAVILGSLIGSTTRRYIKYHITYSPTVLDNTYTTPVVYDVTVNWFTGSGSQKNHSTVDYYLRYDSSMLELEESISDNLGGDTAIINDITVTSAPIILTGSDTDTQWQGTTGTPPAAISASNTLAVSVGTLTYPIQISGGMDITNMTGANPAAAAITFAGGAVGSWVISKVNPTIPTLVITITHAGTITDLRLIGKSFSSIQTPYQASSTSAASIARYYRRTQSINNNWITSIAFAQLIATRIITNQANPFSYIKTLKLTPTPSMQIGDRLNIVDFNTDTNSDYTAVSINETYEVSPNGAVIETDVLPVRIT